MCGRYWRDSGRLNREAGPEAGGRATARSEWWKAGRSENDDAVRLGKELGAALQPNGKSTPALGSTTGTTQSKPAWQSMAEAANRANNYGSSEGVGSAMQVFTLGAVARG